MIHDASTEGIGHFVSINRLHLGEIPWTRQITPILRQKHRNRVIREASRQLAISRLGETAESAPAIHIVAQKVNRIIPAVHVCGQRFADIGIVVGRVSHRNAAVVVGLDVGFHVPCGRFDEGHGGGGTAVVCDFVTDEEAKNVCIVLH